MKILIAIKGCEAHFDRCKAQMNTWVRGHGSSVWYFEGPMLGVPDDYEHLPSKTKAICVWAKDYDYVFLCDTDTYVSIPRLLASRFYLWDYVGHELPGGYASGGAGYWLSKKAMKIVAECDPALFKAEDEMVGAVLAKAGISLHHDYRYTLALNKFVEPDNDIITKHLSMNGPYKTEMMYDAHRRASESVAVGG